MWKSRDFYYGAICVQPKAPCDLILAKLIVVQSNNLANIPYKVCAVSDGGVNHLMPTPN